MLAFFFWEDPLGAHVDCVRRFVPLPFGYVKNNVNWCPLKHDGTSMDNPTCYMHALTAHVKGKGSTLLLSMFAVEFNEWTKKDTHCVAIFATYSSSQPRGYEILLLAPATVETEGSLNGDDHFYFLRFVLGMFEKSRDNFFTHIGDDTKYNALQGTDQIVRLVHFNLRCQTRKAVMELPKQTSTWHPPNV